jgi:hypothetical protein
MTPRRTTGHDPPLPTPPPAPAEETVVSRVIDAPRELVFFAFTLSPHLRHWLSPGSTFDYPERIVCGDPPTLSVSFIAHAGRTTITVRHTETGETTWVDSLDRLAAELDAV